MADIDKTKWDKADIILKPVGGLLTALAVAGVGFFGSQYLSRRQDAETNVRLYSELMSKREEADSALRKDMFNSIIATFLEPKSAGPEQKVLQLEMLAYNFHESIDLGPLFKDVYRAIVSSQTLVDKQVLLDRMTKVARDVTERQIAVLEEAGGKLDGFIDLDELKSSPGGIKIIDDSVTIGSYSKDDSGKHEKKIRVEVLSVDRTRKEVRLRLDVRTHDRVDANSVFWVGFYDFPMIDNTRLSEGQRCAVVLRAFEEESAEVTLVYFPNSRASLKEKPYYDEVISDLKTRERLDHDRTE